jgi:hypothetical protein
MGYGVRSTRKRRAIEGMRSAAETIGRIESGMSMFAITRGQFSMIDVIQHMLDECGRSEVSVWTWAIADYEVECFEGLMNDDRISGGLLVIDRSAEQRNAVLIDRWRGIFGRESVRVCKNHAKVATVAGGGFHLLARGSMNLNFNPRFEQLDVSEGGPEFAMIRKIESELPVLPPKCSNRDAEQASGVLNLWPEDQLQKFRDGKVWQK